MECREEGLRRDTSFLLHHPAEGEEAEDEGIVLGTARKSRYYDLKYRRASRCVKPLKSRGIDC